MAQFFLKHNASLLGRLWYIIYDWVADSWHAGTGLKHPRLTTLVNSMHVNCCFRHCILGWLFFVWEKLFIQTNRALGKKGEFDEKTNVLIKFHNDVLRRTHHSNDTNLTHKYQYLYI